MFLFRDANPSPPSSAVGHERVELYLYSPYGPYGLYRASVPVQGWPLPLPYRGVVGSYTVQFRNWLPKFRRNMIRCILHWSYVVPG